MGLGGQPPVLGSTVDTYVKYDKLEYFRESKCQHFQQTVRTLWRLLVQSNRTSEVLLLLPYWVTCVTNQGDKVTRCLCAYARVNPATLRNRSR